MADFYCEMCGAALYAEPGESEVICEHCGARQTPPQTLPPDMTALLEEHAAAQLRRAQLFLEDGDWKSAEEACEKVLDWKPECAQAYVCKLMAELHISRQDALGNYAWPLDGRDNFRKAVRFADEPLRAQLERYAEQTREKTPRHYDEAKRIMAEDTAARYADALAILEKIPDYRDAKELMEFCRKKIEQENEPDSSGCVLIVCAAILFLAVAMFGVAMAGALAGV